jgi:hypothetical protein
LPAPAEQWNDGIYLDAVEDALRVTAKNPASSWCP